MHEQAIIDEIVGRLDTAGCRVHLVSLVCEEHALRSRLMKDVEAGIRTADIFDRSAERLPLYHALSTCLELSLISFIRSKKQTASSVNRFSSNANLMFPFRIRVILNESR